MDIEYEYSGHCELPLPWNRTMLKMKSDVEKKTGFEYNFVLLNFYESGQAKIGAHKDDKPSLDQSVDIATLSFGACRDMLFSKKDVNQCDKRWKQNPSCYCTIKKNGLMLSLPQPCVKEPRISLTFRRVWSSLQQSLDEMERDYTIPLCKHLRRD
ncbi:hypothetical protein AVEN_265126-1 [Araneus ventricosus]|uniref:Alpha-ketoglutarate-dependent dioxygenase AlkB-like domain-containing protein n=1 Tax=Araneus ventricosus TaxID=182803 RepID=A0A4Y2NLF9_ARAVE|nr:hypothetical protein AVEN_265126-1 [Araneus ventricosus]